MDGVATSGSQLLLPPPSPRVMGRHAGAARTGAGAASHAAARRWPASGALGAPPRTSSTCARRTQTAAAPSPAPRTPWSPRRRPPAARAGDDQRGRRRRRADGAHLATRTSAAITAAAPAEASDRRGAARVRVADQPVGARAQVGDARGAAAAPAAARRRERAHPGSAVIASRLAHGASSLDTRRRPSRRNSRCIVRMTSSVPETYSVRGAQRLGAASRAARRPRAARAARAAPREPSRGGPRAG